MRNSLFSHFNAQTHVQIYLCTWNLKFVFDGVEYIVENILSRLNYHECPTTCRFRNIHPPAFLFLSCCFMPKNVYPLICIITYYTLKFMPFFFNLVSTFVAFPFLRFPLSSLKNTWVYMMKWKLVWENINSQSMHWFDVRYGFLIE